MGFWSKVKKGLKKAWRAVKATVRVIVRVFVEIVYRVINLVFFWLPFKKKIRIQVLILQAARGQPLLDPGDPGLAAALHYAKTTFEDKFSIRLKDYSPIQALSGTAPAAALDVQCDSGAAKNEWGEAGEYFADHLAGWNLIPISLGFPITIYIVRDISGKLGCSLGPLTDYVTVSIKGANSDSTLAHELGHACGLLHRASKSNLMYHDTERGNSVTGWQKFVVRGCRHCTFW